MDWSFAHFRGELVELGVTLNVMSWDTHIGKVEWYIHTVKERMRDIHNTLIFKLIPARLVIEGVYVLVE